MNSVNDVIRAIMKDHKVSQADLARLFNVSPQAIYNKFQRGTWSVDEVIKVLDSVNCKLVVEDGTIRKYCF